jgi:hypothetical protein
MSKGPESETIGRRHPERGALPPFRQISLPAVLPSRKREKLVRKRRVMRRGLVAHYASRLILGQHLLHHGAAYIGQSEVPSLELIGELQMVETHQVQDRGLQVVYVDAVFDGVVT